MDIYTKEIFNFLKTTVIKGSFIADQYANIIKNKFNLPHIEDKDNPYYCHMCGIYSKYDTDDDKIYVESIDALNNGSLILLNKDSYLTYPRTVDSYKLPNDKFYSLLQKYPKKKHTIESILYPVSDIDKAIAAENFSILGYDTSLLEENERDVMVQRLTETVNLFKTQLYIEEFFYEDAYPLVLWGTMWMFIYKDLIDQRIKNIRTPAVHSSHIWNYLISKGIPDYRTILNRKQQYWLYKNLDYLIRNRGKNSNIRLLAENILEPYSVELKQKSILLNYKDGIDEASPIPEIISEDLYASSTPTMDVGDVFESLDTILKLELNNDLRKKYTVDDFKSVSKTATNNLSTYHPTRIVEIDKKKLWSDYHPLYVKFIIDNYLYRYSLGDLNYNININITLSGTAINKSLTVGEAFALLNYCFFLQIGSKDEKIEELVVNPVTIIDPEEREQYTPGWQPGDPIVPTNIPTSIALEMAFEKNHDFTNTKMTFNGIEYSYIEKLFPEVVSMPDLNYTSSEAFMVFLEQQFEIIVDTSIRQRASGEKFLYRAIDALYKPCVLNGRLPITFVEGYTTYDEWFDANLDLKALIDLLKTAKSIDLEYFMVNLSDALFPTDLQFNIVKSSNIFNDKYYKLKQLFSYLCSYSIGFIDTQNDDKINMLTIANVMDIEHNLESSYNFIIKIDTEFYNKINTDVKIESDLEVYSSADGECNWKFEYETSVTFDMGESDSNINFVQWDDIVDTEVEIGTLNQNIDLSNNTTTLTDFELG